ncbi:MAG: hypothetical protein O3A14_11425 [Cyanobacteria bacterium]|nr:hypothetical protein [Cyanobacteriota bacterium]
MPLEFGQNHPWQDNWPTRLQLWQPGGQFPGNELDLTPTSVERGGQAHPRNLTLQWRNAAGVVVLAFPELIPGNDPNTLIPNPTYPVTIDHPLRGLATVRVSGEHWESLNAGITYTLEAIAYGLLYLAQPFTVGLPEPHQEILNGVELYGSPRQVLEVLGQVPGASLEVLVDLSGGWAKDARGYWYKTFANTQKLFGLWIDDRHAAKVTYGDLALHQRAWALVPGAGGPNDFTYTVYYTGSEDLSSAYVETAYNIYVWRCLKEATKEVERKTGRFFNLQRVYREVHRGLRRHRQLTVRQWPLIIDEFFRLDALSYTRQLYRRYQEEDFSPSATLLGQGQVLHGDGPTGVITINQNVWDWWEWGNDGMAADYGLGSFAFLPRGENNLEVTYTAGYEFTPPDLDEAVANLAAVRQGIYWNQTLSAGMDGLSVGCVNLNFSQLFQRWIPAWTASAEQILTAYTHIEMEPL